MTIFDKSIFARYRNVRAGSLLGVKALNDQKLPRARVSTANWIRPHDTFARSRVSRGAGTLRGIPLECIERAIYSWS